MIRVVFDTNVYISAILFGGIPGQLLQEVLRGRLELCTSEEILTEVRGVLLKKFSYPPEKANQVINFIQGISIVVEPRIAIKVIKKWPADNRILECAIEGNVDFLVTGDRKHLLPLGRYGRVKIVEPSEFINLIEDE